MLAFTGLASFAAGTMTLSIYFVTGRAPYEFSDAQQYALGLLVGVTYTLGALGAAAVRRALAARGISPRAFLVLLSLAMAAFACVPLATRSGAAVFALLACYAPLTGLFWPLVEGYVSGGRRGGELRSAIGRFNIVWSLTLLPSFLIPPLLAHSASAVFVAVAATHVVSLACLLGFRVEPGEHGVEEHGVEENAVEEHVAPREYGELLRVHRVLHAMSYLVMYALSPYLPKLLGRLGFVGFSASALGATASARALGFALLERWHGWHGRWSVAVIGALLVLGGFGGTLLAPGLGPEAPTLVALALFLFGAGLAALYTAALYYAFEVGGNEGGGSHEALIGLGYSIGPSCGLVVCALERGGVIEGTGRDGALHLVITAICVGAALLAWRARRVPSAGGA